MELRGSPVGIAQTQMKFPRRVIQVERLAELSFGNGGVVQLIARYWDDRRPPVSSASQHAARGPAN